MRYTPAHTQLRLAVMSFFPAPCRELLGKLGESPRTSSQSPCAQLRQRTAQEDRGAFVQRQVFEIKLLFGVESGMADSAT